MKTTTRQPDRIRKAEMLTHWASLKPQQPIEPAVVPYKHSGSTYSQDGIRITGSREFIDSVLSRLQDLLQYENGETRLHVAYAESTDKSDRTCPLGSYSCYIQVHERGQDAKACNAFVAAMTSGRPADYSTHMESVLERAFR